MASSDQDSVGKVTRSVKDFSIAVNGDDELAELLSSALDDFTKPSEPTPSPSTSVDQPVTSTRKKQKASSESTSNASAFPCGVERSNNVDEVFQNLLSQDAVLKEHWEKLAESCSKAAQNPDFEASLEETLKNITENAQSIAQNPELSEEDLAKVWADLGLNDPSKAGDGPLSDFMPLITSMMQNLLSKEVLYPALKDLTQKYPTWLEDNKDNLSESDFTRYEKQLDLMRKVCHEFETESSTDSDTVKNERFQRILSLMQQMQECGSPPKDLVGDVPDLTSADFSKLSGLGNNGQQFSIQ